MKTIKFHKTECGVDFLLNVLPYQEIGEDYFTDETFNTDFFEIVFFKSGSGSIVLNQQSIPIKENTAVFISPFQKREWHLDTHNLDCTMLAFQEGFLNDFFADKLFTFKLLYFYQLEFPLIMELDEFSFKKYCEQLSEIKTELLAKRKDSVHIIRSLLYYLLQKLNRQYAEKHNLSFENSANNYGFDFKRLLEIHLKEKQRISDYTEILNVSRVTLNKAVKEKFNVTATTLLKQRLLLEIKNLLIYSNKNIQEIAFELNFSEPNHLMRFFKAQTGKTTSEFLESYQNGILS